MMLTGCMEQKAREGKGEENLGLLLTTHGERNWGARHIHLGLKVVTR